jgi:hypothetical protein
MSSLFQHVQRIKTGRHFDLTSQSDESEAPASEAHSAAPSDAPNGKLMPITVLTGMKFTATKGVLSVSKWLLDGLVDNCCSISLPSNFSNRQLLAAIAAEISDFESQKYIYLFSSLSNGKYTDPALLTNSCRHGAGQYDFLNKWVSNFRSQLGARKRGSTPVLIVFLATPGVHCTEESESKTNTTDTRIDFFTGGHHDSDNCVWFEDLAKHSNTVRLGSYRVHAADITLDQILRKLQSALDEHMCGIDLNNHAHDVFIVLNTRKDINVCDGSAKKGRKISNAYKCVPLADNMKLLQNVASSQSIRLVCAERSGKVSTNARGGSCRDAGAILNGVVVTFRAQQELLFRQKKTLDRCFDHFVVKAIVGIDRIIAKAKALLQESLAEYTNASDMLARYVKPLYVSFSER